MTTRLILKNARGFRSGEWLYLFGCDTGDGLYGLVYGLYLINEIKRVSDAGRTFICEGIGKSSHSYVRLEFADNQPLHRLAGEPLACVIQEAEEVTT